MARAEAYPQAKFHLDPSNRLATMHQRHRQDRQTGQTDRQDRRTVGEHTEERFTNGRPKMSTIFTTHKCHLSNVMCKSDCVFADLCLRLWE